MNKSKKIILIAIVISFLIAISIAIPVGIVFGKKKLPPVPIWVSKTINTYINLNKKERVFYSYKNNNDTDTYNISNLIINGTDNKNSYMINFIAKDIQKSKEIKGNSSFFCEKESDLSDNNYFLCKQIFQRGGFDPDPLLNKDQVTAGLALTIIKDGWNFFGKANKPMTTANCYIIDFTYDTTGELTTDIKNEGIKWTFTSMRSFPNPNTPQTKTIYSNFILNIIIKQTTTKTTYYNALAAVEWLPYTGPHQTK